MAAHSGRPFRSEDERREEERGKADVVLDVSELHVDKVDLEAQDLEAHVSLNVEAAGLLELKAGVDIRLDKVRAFVEKVDTTAHLRVHLDHVAAIVTRVFDSVDRNAEIFRDVMLEAAEAEDESRLEAGSDSDENEE